MTMNTEKINRLIVALKESEFLDSIEYNSQELTSDLRVFNMNHYYHECGTPSCIAGWAAHLANPNFEYHWRKLTELKDAAAAYIGIENLSDICELFTPDCVDLYEVTPEEAIKTLEKLRDTGRVNWSHAMSYTGEFDEEDMEG